MHQFLRAVGFSEIKTKKQIKDLMNDVILHNSGKNYIDTDRNSILVEYVRDYSDSLGLCLLGEYDEEENLTLSYYFPYVKSQVISTSEDVTIERHAAEESFAGVVEDYRIGVTVIFYLQNNVEIMKKLATSDLKSSRTTTYFTGLSLNGMILLPIEKNETEKAKCKKASKERSERIVAAKNGDEEAIEKLTLEDIDTYSAVTKRILKDDVYSLVDSYFMPYGVECDHYSILGEIEECSVEVNSLTNEKIHVMEINCNGMPLTVCINDLDLMGEPKVGRRFKGSIWLQGFVANI